MATLSISLYMLIFALLCAFVLVCILLRPRPTYLKILEDAVGTDEETKRWSSKEIREQLKHERQFIGENVSISFDTSKIILERLGKKQKVIQKLIIDNADVVSAQRTQSGQSQTLYNGVVVYEQYFVNIVFSKEQQLQKIRILFLLDKEDQSNSERVNKIRVSAYTDAIAEKINDIGKRNKGIKEATF